MSLDRRESSTPDGQPSATASREARRLGAGAAVMLLAVLLYALAAAGSGLPAAGTQRLSSTADEPAATLVTELVALIREHYILDTRIPEIERTLGERLESDAYEGPDHDVALALTRDLRAASSDLHFGVRPVGTGSDGGAPTGSPKGLRRTEVLAANVGYLEIAAFVDPAVGAGAVDSAFAELAGTDALLIDVRSSRGGHPAMVAYLASYLFAGEPFVLNRIYWRNRDETMEFRTRTDLPSPRYLHRPVFVLTSAATPSAAEGFSYHLKHFDRATIVGEVTAGAAHPVQVFPLGGSFRVAIPTGRAINPRTGTNWEGVGVQPDEKVAADQALSVGHRLAIEALLERATEPGEVDRLQSSLAELESRID